MHPSLFYPSSQEYLAGLVPFITDGLAAAEPVLVAVPGERIELLRAGLGRAADQVRFVDMTDAGRNPGRIIPRLLSAFVDEHPAQSTRVIGEPIWAGRTAAEYPACVQHEALINVALADRPVTIVCPYDTARLDPAVLADAGSTHPLLIEHGQWHPNPDFTDPATVVQSWNQPLPEPAESTTLVFTAPDGPRQVRRVAHEVAEREGLTGRRLTDLLLAVNEIAVNTLLHTGRPGIFSIWRDPTEIVCQVHDSGHLADPLAGRHHPAPYDLAEAGGHGLRLVHDLCDLVRIHTQPEATTIRLHMRIPRAGGDTADGATGRGGSRAPSLPPASPVPPARPPTGPLQRPTWPEPAEPDPDDQNVDGTGDGGSDGDGDGEVGAARGDEAPEALPPSASPPASAPPASAFPEADALWADSPGAVVRATVTRQAAYTRDAVRYEVRTQLFHHWRRRVVDLLPLRPGEVVLDVGCGSGLCFPLLQQCIGPGGTIIGIETAPEMLALARQQILERGWRNVVLVESAAEDAVIPRRADHALFCAVHDVLQSPAALRTVLARVRPGGTVAAVGGKWAPPWAVGLNTLVAATHAPFVRNFTGFDRPWAGLAPHLTNFLIREIEMGCGYLAAGQTPADNQVGGLT